MSGYQGWANWATWAAVLWLSNFDEVTYTTAVRISRMKYSDERKKVGFINLLKGTGNPDEIPYAEVNWHEVIEAMSEE